MRFHDQRPTIYKRTTTEPEGFSVATPQRLSPLQPDGVSVREEVNAADIQRPQHDRQSRRGMGIRRPRRRIGGVALIAKPWQPMVEEAAAA